MGNGRDTKGRFTKGNQFGERSRSTGRPTNAAREALRLTIDKNVPQSAVDAAWKRVAAALEQGGQGWLDIFRFYLDRRFGKPEQYHELGGAIDLTETKIVIYEYEDTDGGA